MLNLEEDIENENTIELTPRERKILKLIILGYENNEIASKLYVSTHTVKFYVSSVIKKLGAKNRTHAAYLALQQNIFKN